MRLRLIFLSLALGTVAGYPVTHAQESPTHWNQFRGPRGDGTSLASQLPVKFDESNNIRWKTPIPDSGWSSPVVWKNEIWLTTGSDKGRLLSAVCVDLESGKITKNITVFEMIERKIDSAYGHDSPHLNSPATPTPVVEEHRVFVSFGSQGIACLDRATGRKLWERRDLRIYQPVRQGSSPIVDAQNLYVAFDGNDQQFFIALDKNTGETRWMTQRNVTTEWDAKLSGGSKPGDNNKSFATAQLIEVDGKRQLIAPAAEATISYDPDTGKEIWRVLYPGGFNVSARPIYANGLVYVFTSGVTHDLLAIRPDGRGDVTDTHVAWLSNRSSPNIPSPIVTDDLLFMVTDKGGIARCLDAVTGEEIWRKRLGGDHWASPLYANGNLYFSSKQGDVTVLKASKQEPDVVARNEMNASFIASPAIADQALILRSTTHLYCVSDGYTRSMEQVEKEMKQPSSKAVAQTSEAGKAKAAIDWDAAYEKLLRSSPEVQKKVDDGQATKEQIIAFLKQKAGNLDGIADNKNQKRGKPGARKGSVNFYAIVIGKLRSKDIELGQLELDVDYVLSNADWAKKELVGQRVKLVGVAGAFLDNLLRIKRGETIKIRTGDYTPDTKVLGFGYKFQVLERTPPFNPEDFGVPPPEFRGFRGELTGKVVEAQGYEILLDVQKSQPLNESLAKNADSILGKRIRIAGFYNQHADAFADLHEGDKIRVSVTHRNSESDSLDVTTLLDKVDDGVIGDRSIAPTHTPTKMPKANAESVGMSTDGLHRIDEVMKEHVAAGHIQGAITMVARKGKVVHFSTHGQMDANSGRKMETDAIFRMASSTKPVLGVAAMMLMEEGLISPHDPVSKYIPEFADVKVAVTADRATATVKGKGEIPEHRLVPVDTPVTIHHLLTHTSGLRSGGLGALVDPVGRRTTDDTLATYVPKLAKVPLDFQPGTKWSYSARDGLDVVARIIEIVSETPFDEFLRKRIFDPLEMNSTFFNLPADLESKRVVMAGRWAKLKGWGKRTEYFSASGGLSSAAEDYLHFEQMLLNGGELFGHRLLAPDSVRMMGSNQVGDLFTDGKKGQKGMGFGYTVAVTLDPTAASNSRGKGAFGWGGAFGTISWTDPKNELVAVMMVQQPHRETSRDFGEAIRQAIIE